MNSEDYTTNSWKAVSTALGEAKKLNKESKQSDVDAATEKLNNAVTALVRIANLSELNKAITAAEALNSEDYTTDSWKAVSTALDEAKKLNEESKQSDVDAATEKLNNAVTALVKIVNLTELNKAIVNAEALNSEDYTTNSWKAVSTALDEAKKLNKESKQSDVDAATEKLNKAVKALVKAVDTSKLQELVDAVKAMNAKDYTAETWAEVETAVDAASDVLGKTDVDQNTIDQAKTTLEKAIAGLKKVDKEPEQPVTPDQPSDSDKQTTITNNSSTISASGKLDKDVQLITKEYSTDEIQKVIKALENNELMKNLKIEKAFDIYLLKDGAIVQPDGTITIRIKVDADLLKKDLQVIYINDENQVSNVTTRKGSDYVEFDVNHLSIYAITSKTGSTITGTDVNTGDTTNTGMLAVVMLISAAGMMFLLRKKHQEE